MVKHKAKPKPTVKKPPLAVHARKSATKPARSISRTAQPGGIGQTALLKDFYRRWSETKGANFEDVLSHLADDVVWRSISNGLHGLNFAKEPLNKQTVRTYFESLFKEWELVFFEIERFVEQGNTVVAIAECSFRHRRTGKSFMSPKVDIWDFKRGKIVGFNEYFDTASAIRSAL